ncbi:MAG: cupin domain-containing protein [Planktomarina sp.]
MPKLDLSTAKRRTGSIYPAPYDAEMAGRSSLRLAQLGGLSQFGVNLVRLEPGAKASLRHWHLREDEFAMITQGACTLVDDTGRFPMAVGDCAAFPAGEENGHHFVNETDQVMEFLVIGTSFPNEEATYSDVDLKVTMSDHTPVFTRRDGAPLDGENNG